MFLQARPDNPPEGEVYIYPDAQTGKPVWQDKDGVHGFGNEDAIVGAMFNGEDVEVADKKLVLNIDIPEPPEIPDDYINGATISGENVPVEGRKLVLDDLIGSGDTDGGISGATVNGNAVETDSQNRLILSYPKVFVLDEEEGEPTNFKDGDILIVP
jgi:hypothetical protein